MVGRNRFVFDIGSTRCKLQMAYDETKVAIHDAGVLHLDSDESMMVYDMTVTAHTQFELQKSTPQSCSIPSKPVSGWT